RFALKNIFRWPQPPLVPLTSTGVGAVDDPVVGCARHTPLGCAVDPAGHCGGFWTQLPLESLENPDGQGCGLGMHAPCGFAVEPEGHGANTVLVTVCVHTSGLFDTVV